MFSGDFNIILSNVNDITSNCLSVIYSHFLFPTITLPILIIPHSAIIVDNLFINSSTFISFAAICFDILHHLPIIYITGAFKKDLKNTSLLSNNNYCLNLKNLNNLRNNLAKVNCDCLL